MNNYSNYNLNTVARDEFDFEAEFDSHNKVNVDLLHFVKFAKRLGFNYIGLENDRLHSKSAVFVLGKEKSGDDEIKKICKDYLKQVDRLKIGELTLSAKNPEFTTEPHTFRRVPLYIESFSWDYLEEITVEEGFKLLEKELLRQQTPGRSPKSADVARILKILSEHTGLVRGAFDPTGTDALHLRAFMNPEKGYHQLGEYDWIEFGNENYKLYVDFTLAEPNKDNKIMNNIYHDGSYDTLDPVDIEQGLQTLKEMSENPYSVVDADDNGDSS